MIKIFVPKKLKGEHYLPILEGNYGEKNLSESFLFNNNVIDEISKPLFDLKDNIEDAEYLLIPHNYFSIRGAPDFIESFVALSKKHDKKILVVAYGDSSESINIENSIVLRTSQYKSELKKNEIIIPAIVEDLGKSGISFRKKEKHPVVGFCGWAGFNDFERRVKYFLKNLFLNGSRKQGLYFRRKAIKVFSSSKSVRTNFKIRRSYSANKKTILLSPEKAREEFIENIKNSDIVLSVKGDGNYSARFYEAISMGRPALLIDTDTPLPLEDEIYYERFIVRVDYREISSADKILWELWKGLSEEEFLSMQRYAREAFVNYFKPGQFYTKWLPKLLENIK